MSDGPDRLRELTAQVASAYFSNSHVAPTDIDAVISTIASSLGAVGEPVAPPQVEPEAPTKPTSAKIRKSITADALISFEDGRAYKTLRRHLTTRGLTPEGYRAKWGLPDDYPMVSPSYSEQRSAMAKAIGLGQMRQAPKARRGRPPKAKMA